MRFGVFYELQLPRPWSADAEHRLVQEALQQIELADRLGIDYAWAVEHHFLEEYSHCSASEVFLAAAAGRTKNIRLGHGIRQVIANYNHPARTAEAVAIPDLVSNGRADFGIGEVAAQNGLIALGGQFGHDGRREIARNRILAENGAVDVQDGHVEASLVGDAPYVRAYPLSGNSASAHIACMILAQALRVFSNSRISVSNSSCVGPFGAAGTGSPFSTAASLIRFTPLTSRNTTQAMIRKLMQAVRKAP